MDGVASASPCAAAREWWWSQIKKGYADYGIEVFWLDAAEPEQMGGSPPGSAWHAGSMERVGMMFPYYHSQTYFEGLTAMGASDGMMLSRSAWAGMQKHRAALWNGDTHSTFDFLKTAIAAGLGAQLSGIAWWTVRPAPASGRPPPAPSVGSGVFRVRRLIPRRSLAAA